jgi:transposase-like protein
VIDRGHGVVDVAKRLGVSDKSLYLWVRLAREQQGLGSGETASLRSEVSRPGRKPSQMCLNISRGFTIESAGTVTSTS